MRHAFYEVTTNIARAHTANIYLYTRKGGKVEFYVQMIHPPYLPTFCFEKIFMKANYGHLLE